MLGRSLMRLFIPPTSDNPGQTTRVPVFIKVLDVNDNAPEFAMSYDTFVCENVKAGQVRRTSTRLSWAARSQ